ncbi:MAG: N-acetylmuramic acid 6-phosphate etherase [Gemmatales bacterium]
MSHLDDAAHLTTEAQNPASVHLDRLSTSELVSLMNREDALVAQAVADQQDNIARAIDVITEKLNAGGRLIYIGAGTSGRLGVLDAAECPPTFSTPPELVVGIIAGGPPALTQAVEGAEDNFLQAASDLERIRFCKKDVLVGITASGRAPYVLGAVWHARQLSAFTIGISCNADAQLNEQVDIPIAVVVGPEVLSGSTRLKAGTATKLVLNMLSTGAMIKRGKTFGNLMVDLKATNSKLLARARRIVQTVTQCSVEQAAARLDRCEGEVKTAIVAQMAKLDPMTARYYLQKTGGNIAQALQRVGIDVYPKRQRSDLILGIDGGGTSTKAILARRVSDSFEIVGHGKAGPSNRQSVGDLNAISALRQAIHAAFHDANIPFAGVASACFGLAGADRSEDRQFFHQWATRAGIAESITIANDVELVLAAGTPEGWGLALIAGTGSMAFGKNQTGTIERAGGWGYLMGDKGSAYSIAVDALQVAAIEIDTGLTLDGEAITEQNAILPLLMSHWKLDDPKQLVRQVYGTGMDRKAIAQLAPIILDAYFQGNSEPRDLIENNAMHLAGDAAIVMRKLFDQVPQVPVALAGGIFQNHPWYAEMVMTHLRRCRATEENPEPLGPIQTVNNPAEGALKLACLTGRTSPRQGVSLQ